VSSASGASPNQWASPIVADRHADATLVSSSSMLAAGAAGGTGDRIEELQHHLAYTQEVLRKYKLYVETKVMDQLRQSQRTVEVLQLDCQRVERERDKLIESLSGKSAELEARKSAMNEFTSKLSHESQQGSLKQAEHISELERRHAAQVSALRKTIDSLQSDATQTQSLQAALSRRDEEVKRLRQSIAESSNRTAWMQNDHAAYSEISHDVIEASSGLIDFFNTVTSAIGDQLLRTTNLPDQSVLGEVRDLPPLEHSSPAAARGGGGGGHQYTAQTVATQVKSFRDQLQVAQREVVVMLRVLLEAHMSAIGSYEETLADADKERTLFRRRMEELEEDRTLERKSMEALLEEHKLKSVLAQTPPAKLYGMSGRQSVLANGTVDVASLLMQGDNGSPTRRARHISTGSQTAIDVTVFTAVAAPQAGALNSTVSGISAPSPPVAGTVPVVTYNRLLHEVARLQEDNNELRRNVHVLDSQRQRFLGFVNNNAITASIANVMQHGNASVMQFL
jgi:hypothetical protein